MEFPKNHNIAALIAVTSQGITYKTIMTFEDSSNNYDELEGRFYTEIDGIISRSNLKTIFVVPGENRRALEVYREHNRGKLALQIITISTFRVESIFPLHNLYQSINETAYNISYSMDTPFENKPMSIIVRYIAETKDDFIFKTLHLDKNESVRIPKKNLHSKYENVKSEYTYDTDSAANFLFKL